MKPSKDALQQAWATSMHLGQAAPKGDLQKLSHDKTKYSAGKVRLLVFADLAQRSFKTCGLSMAQDGSEAGEVHERFMGVKPPAISAPGDRCSSVNDATDIVFNDDSEV